MIIGHHYRPRDKRGWRIPEEGTQSRRIYDLARRGLTTTQIARELDKPYNNIKVLLRAIRQPERIVVANRLHKRAMRARQLGGDNGI